MIIIITLLHIVNYLPQHLHQQTHPHLHLLHSLIHHQQYPTIPLQQSLIIKTQYHIHLFIQVTV